jgi:hypothetical protein
MRSAAARHTPPPDLHPRNGRGSRDGWPRYAGLDGSKPEEQGQGGMSMCAGGGHVCAESEIWRENKRIKDWVIPRCAEAVWLIKRAGGGPRVKC